jgi:hypothetical protein
MVGHLCEWGILTDLPEPDLRLERESYRIFAGAADDDDGGAGDIHHYGNQDSGVAARFVIVP